MVGSSDWLGGGRATPIAKFDGLILRLKFIWLRVVRDPSLLNLIPIREIAMMARSFKRPSMYFRSAASCGKPDSAARISACVPHESIEAEADVSVLASGNDESEQTIWAAVFLQDLHTV